MIAVTAGLLLVVLLKAIAVVNAIRWLHSRGPAFAAAVAAEPPETVVDQELLYDRFEAGFFPFGVKDYRVRRMARQMQGPRQLLVGLPLRVFQSTLFNLALLAALACAYLVALASAPPVPFLLPGPVHDTVALALALSLIVTTILIAVEAVYSYAVIGSYGQGFHELRPQRRRPERALVREFQVFVGALLAAHLAGLGAMYLISHRFGGYAKVAVSTPDLAGVSRQALDCSYYTLATFVGAGDPEPLTAVGKLASGMVVLQGLAFVVLVLASMFSIVGNGRVRPVREPAAAQPAASLGHGSVERSSEPPTVPCRHDGRPDAPGPGHIGAFALGAAAGVAGVVAVVAWAHIRRTSRDRPGPAGP